MIATLLYLAGLLATLVVGIVIGVWFTRRHEAERLDAALMLRSIGEATRCPDHVALPPGIAGAVMAGADDWLSADVIRQQTIRSKLADAWEADTDQWEQVANALDFPMHDYTGKDRT